MRLSHLHRAVTRLRRRPAIHWTAAVALAAATGLTVTTLVGAAAAERDRYGDVVPVLVATRDLDGGDVLAAGDTELRRMPAALVPSGALDARADGLVLSDAVYAGEPVLRSRLAPEGLGAVAALLPPGTRGIAVPDDGAGLRLASGDVVDVLATFDAGTAGAEDGGPPTVAVARDALVVDVSEEGVTIAVTEEQAPRVAFAVAAGLVTLALSGAS